MPEDRSDFRPKLEVLRSRLNEIDEEILALTDKATLDAGEEERYEDLCAERDAVLPEFTKLEERAARRAEIVDRADREIRGNYETRVTTAELFSRDVRQMDWREARDGALKILNDGDGGHSLRAAQGDAIDAQVRKDPDLAKRIIVTENDAYRSAFMKLTTQVTPILTPEENHAVLRVQEYRAAAEGADTSGAFAVPVFIDPSVILVDQESDNPFLSIARQVTITTNAWKGVSAAGVSWSFDTEASEVSDDSITLAQPTVDIFTARGFIPYSIEIGEDWPGFQAEMSRLLMIGYDELLLEKFTTGNGSTEPKGILVALDANTNVEVVGTTDGLFGQEDVYKVWGALPQKYRRRASWMMSVGINNKIRQMGVYPNSHAATVQLPAAAADVLFSRAVYENPYFPGFTGTTGAENRLVVGDFEDYVVAKRSGMSVELVPHLFDTANNLPSGQRGWFAYARIGGNSVNDLAFRLLQNQ